MILRDSLTIVCLGVGAGIAAAYSASRLVATMLFGMSAADPLTYGTVVVILIVVAFLASVLPAWRAARVDPMVAFRQS
jgi:ABC-type antimicrobial peptide transport system permease subunit